MANIQGRNMQLYVLICVIIYSCVLTIYLIHFSDYIIDQHNGNDSPQTLHYSMKKVRRFQVLVVMLLEVQVQRYITPCLLVSSNRSFEES